VVRAFLRSERAGEIFRFGLVTVMSAAVTLGMPVLLHQVLGVQAEIAVAIAYVMAFAINFVSTRSFVFKSDGAARDDLLRYTATSATFRLAEYLAFLALYNLNLIYFVAQIIVQVCSLLLKFFVFRKFVYKAPPTSTAP
jgi:putative flippase GtrA